MTGEQRSISRSEAPITVARLAGDLRALGVREGSGLLVHTSVSARATGRTPAYATGAWPPRVAS